MYPGREEGIGIKAAPQASLRRREGRGGSRSARKVSSPAAGMHSGGPGCARSGLRLQRIRSDPIRAWALGFAPSPGAASARPTLVGTGRPPQDSFPSRTQGWRWNPTVSTHPGFGSLPQRGLGLPPLRPFEAPPRACGCLGPRLRARRVAGGFLAGGGSCQPSTRRAAPRPRPAGLPPVHLSANAVRGAVRLAAAPLHICLSSRPDPGVCLSLRQADRAGPASELRAAGRARRAGWGRR